MKIYLNETVFEASLNRIRRLFDEFENVCVFFSGGKDSTITLELALIVARERNKLPLKVYFLDQEAEWQFVIDYVKEVMSRDEVEPFWVQVPIFFPNSLSQGTPFITLWEEGKKWMREKDPIAIKDNHVLEPNIGGEVKLGFWYKYFERAAKNLFPDSPACFLGGMRAQESPARFTAVTGAATYKDITYGKILNKKLNHYTFYPIYDWDVSDVWKAIHDNKWSYCKLYDEHYKYGVAIKDMRVSSLIHETALKNLFFLHELEKDTWNALNERMDGVNMAKHMDKDGMLMVSELPVMFKSWKEYRDFLTEKLITNDRYKSIFKSEWEKMDETFSELRTPDDLYKRQVVCVLAGDVEFTKLRPYINSSPLIAYDKWRRGVLRITDDLSSLKQIKEKYLMEMGGALGK